MSKRTLVTGAGGFIGGHLVSRLRREGVEVRAVDSKPMHAWYQRFPDTESLVLDLSDRAACYAATKDVGDVYSLAADMGGMEFIEHNRALCMLSVLVTTHMLLGARDNGVERFFYSSSACVYAADKQENPDIRPLAEDDAYPAMPEDGYGWEKLFSERMCRHFSEDFGLVTRVARYHNVYGPSGTFEGGREKAPAAVCRKVAQAVMNGEQHIEIWGDGKQTRSFMYVDDCIEGTRRLMDSAVGRPVNLGSDRMVTVDELVDIVENIAGVRLERRYRLDAPQGVRGRNSDNTLIRTVLGWEPQIRLEDGLATTYEWVHDQLRRTVAA
jgi:nucleoside-diphosphate-sugar epimerase